MKLLRCDIVNFRSIKELTIYFDKYLKIFIGYNEAGKSNIIKALSLLNKNNTNISNDDARDSYSDGDYQKKAYVWFIFEFGKEEIDNLCQDFLSKIYIKNEDDIAALSVFCKNNNQLLYCIDLLYKNKSYSYWSINSKNYPILKGKINKIKDGNQSTININGEIINLSKYKYLLVDENTEISNKIIDGVEFDELIRLFFETKKNLAIKLHPQVVFWSYNDFQNIPQKISITAFTNNPDSCIALKNMFLLSDIYEIKDEIEEAKDRKNGLANLLRRISKVTTDYIHSVWPEQASIKINLNENGDNIEFAIEDEENFYDFSRRSDGFKRFVSFLLSIGAQNKADDIKDILLLIDEPDIGLHPSSSRQLMKELINVSKNNFVYYTTHSIFMINKEDIGSHYIVKKEKEITEIEEIEISNILDEEILYNALGYSVFDNLKKNNIIFEGWRDKKLFTIGLNHFNNNKEISTFFNEMGFCYSQGVKDIHRIVSMLDLARRNYIIISDSDKPAQEARGKSPEKNKWLMYRDINSKIITSEDFLTIEYNNACFKSICEKYSLSIIDVSPIQQGDIISQYSDILKNVGVERDKIKNILNDYKELVYENISVDKIEVSYFDFIESLIKKIKEYLDELPNPSSEVPHA